MKDLKALALGMSGASSPAMAAEPRPKGLSDKSDTF